MQVRGIVMYYKLFHKLHVKTMFNVDETWTALRPFMSTKLVFGDPRK
jgi:hypothetical protein